MIKLWQHISQNTNKIHILKDGQETIAHQHVLGLEVLQTTTALLLHYAPNRSTYRLPLSTVITLYR